MDISPDVWRDTILFLIALILSVSVHEFGHAWAASRMGDSLPRAQGRLTLNPVRHIDPIGTLVFPVLMSVASVGLLGWGRPVMTNPANYTRKWSRSTSSMFVAVTGPAMNLMMAAFVSLIIVVGRTFGVMELDTAVALIRYLVALNLTLLFFNLLPIPPLDGGAVLAWVLPRSMQGAIDFLSRWGFLILIALFIIPIGGRSLLGWLMLPATKIIQLWAMVILGAAGA